MHVRQDPSVPSRAEQASTPRGVVVTYTPPARFRSRHERATHAELARRLAVLKGHDFVGRHDPSRNYPGPVYVVPDDTLVGGETARALGVAGGQDLFGGVVPHRFVATKAITHRLVHRNASAPDGWSHAFGKAVRHAVLDGYTAFTLEDARRAGARLLQHGPARLKTVHAKAGRGQAKLENEAELDAALAAMDEAALFADGVVLEQNLTDVTTFSVGQVRVAELIATYHGTQRLTRDNAGEEVYGGSSLVVARGGFEALSPLLPSEEVRLAVAQARAYDGAASECFAGFFASRRNYDVARGRDAAGRWHSGVLEQSWRMGGASGAEIAALEAFRAHPALHAVRAQTIELYGKGHEPPPHATVYFHGTDECVGPMTKYAVVSFDDPR